MHPPSSVLTNDQWPASRSRGRRLGGEAGQQLVEFAILLPILVGLLVGIWEFGRAWNVYQVLTNAARDGARLAVIPTSTEETVRESIRSALGLAALDPERVEITIDGLGAGTGTPATVQIRYPYEFAFLRPIMGLFPDGAGGGVPGSITLSSAAVMRNE